MRLGLALLLALAGCSGGSNDGQAADAPQDLETAAIERGMVTDPTAKEIAGLYARDTDRLCIAKDGMGYKVGAFVDYGDGITCSGSGTLSRAGETLHVELGGDGCSFDARFDGEKIRFPGVLPDGCKALCSQRASYAGLEVARLSDSAAEAAALRDANGRRLCQ